MIFLIDRVSVNENIERQLIILTEQKIGILQDPSQTTARIEINDSSALIRLRLDREQFDSLVVRLANSGVIRIVSMEHVDTDVLSAVRHEIKESASSEAH